MKRSILLIISGVLLCFCSCKKCYMCTCTDTTVLGGCSVAGQQTEMCDKGLVGKSMLTVRVSQKESEGNTCTLE